MAKRACGASFPAQEPKFLSISTDSLPKTHENRAIRLGNGSTWFNVKGDDV